MSWLDDFWKNLFRNPGWFFNPNNVVSAMNETTNDSSVNHILNNAQKDPTKAQGDIASQGLAMSPEQEKYLDNLIAQQNVANNNAFQQQMRDTALTSAGKQLEALGLSASGVLSTGGAASGVQSSAADNVKTNVAMERYQQRMALAKQLLSMTSSMASAGIYGHAIGAAKRASSILTSSASNSALDALNWADDKPSSRLDRAELLRQLREGDIPSNAAEGLPF